MLSKVNTVIAAAMLLLCIGCGQTEKSASDEKTAVCGLPPVAFIAEQIGGGKFKISSMLPEGRSPHDYSPRPADVRNAGRAKFFFTTGMNFENNAVKSLPDTVKIVDVSANIKRRPFDDGHGSCDGHGEDHHHHGEESLDPHVWLSPVNAVIIGEAICSAMSEADPENRDFYHANSEKLKQQFNAADADMKKRLAPYAGREFLVYHPAFGYFADAVKLLQCPLEINGREMTAVQLANVISKAEKENIKVVFVQKQFNPRLAGELARRIGGKALPLDPLAYDLPGNFKAMTDAIAQGFGGGE